MKQKAVIGIILDWEEKGTFSDFPHFALRTHYSRAVTLAGGLPLMIPYSDINLIDDYLEQIDGLLVPGGFYAMPNDWYLDQKDTSPYEITPRFQFESEILLRAIKMNKQVFGICGGMQVIAGLMGCKLIPDIKKYLGTKIEHFDLNKDHELEITPNTKLHQIIGKEKIIANSHNNEAIIEIATNVVISAKAIDGVIEAIELADRDFVIGLQGHHEMLCSKKEDLKNYNQHHLIFKEFVKKSHEDSNK